MADVFSPGEPDVLPPLYARWANEFLSGAIPPETEAACTDCAMLCDTSGNAGAVAPFFNPETKCCTYLPVLPNFLVGRMLSDDSAEFARGRTTLEERLAAGVAITPLGIGRSAEYDLLYATSGKSFFGRDRTKRCPHYLDESGGQCGIWQHRSAVCATWFCKYVRGAVGQRFWQVLHRLLSAVERDLSRWCAQQLRADSDGFDEWSGRERQYFQECARLIEGFRWRDVMKICGPDVRALVQDTRQAFEDLQSRAIPRRLRVGSFKVIGPYQQSSIVEGYDGGDRIALPNALLDALHHFNGSSSTTHALQTIQTETGLAIERDLVRLLVDFEILIPANHRE